MRSRVGSATLVAAHLALACGGSPGGSPPPDPGEPGEPPPPFTPLVDLRADLNRDGAVSLDDPSDDEGEETWTAARGAVFLANLDDDLDRCGESLLDGAEYSDSALAACHDAADDVVNGPDDLLDLARLRAAPWPGAPDDAVGTLAVSPSAAAARVRLFVWTAGEPRVLLPGAEISAAALRSGLELGIEGKDVVRDRAVWDGLADVTFAIQRRGRPETRVADTVRLRVAPIVFFHHALPAHQVFAPVLQPVTPGDAADVAASAAFRAALAPALAAAGTPEPLWEFPPPGLDPGLGWRDRWAQDLYEPGFMSMPGPGGTQHVLRVNLRAANVDAPGALYSPLRRTSRVVYFLRGRDQGVVQQFQLDLPAAMQTLNSMGNTEVVPPHDHAGASYPLGRVLRGRTDAFFPDPSQTRLIEAQGIQPPIYVDTSWLWVAHVDEVLAFLPSSASPRGWVLLANDPRLARRMLEELSAAGHGSATLFTGLATRHGAPAEVTVDEVLANADVAARSESAAVHMEVMLDRLRAEIGLLDEDIVPAPFLHHTVGGRSAAYQPGTANLLALSPSLVAAPDPHGPMVDGQDVFKAQLEQALAPHGVSVWWVDGWSLLHEFIGEVHCGTNASRAIPEARWWEAMP